MSDAVTYDEFEGAARAAGFDEVLERRWVPHLELDTHAHPFDVEARVVEGEMWLTQDGVARHLTAGGTFAVPRDVPHAERYGAAGTVVWVARRHPR
jgi:mannose-6-phosphate isomerase-like protein (cupin superfamily)